MTPNDYENLRAQIPILTHHGLCRGVGGLKSPGDLCVMQAVTWAENLSLHSAPQVPSDSPECVAPFDREAIIRLNDRGQWGSGKERSEYLTPLALAAVGSVDRARFPFLRNLVVHLTKRLVDPTVRNLGDAMVALEPLRNTSNFHDLYFAATGTPLYRADRLLDFVRRVAHYSAKEISLAFLDAYADEGYDFRPTKENP